ncbi:hypothetical protein WICPIJ_003644 [Wickerhamomyces pijperi]|uniref:Uncharacterized protein n=1 Tax=Wickerhamomyces pijperi TaxID=599730 RepID=A0A9P8Q9H0_WICPI|nr:hypothetical protein WICPIJ_003644 [Wickerhamomyces pijperi]
MIWNNQQAKEEEASWEAKRKVKMASEISLSEKLTTLFDEDLGLSGTGSEGLHGHIGGSLTVPGLSIWDDDWEVDQFQSSGDQVVIVGNFLDLFVGDVVTTEGLQ